MTCRPSHSRWRFPDISPLFLVFSSSSSRVSSSSSAEIGSAPPLGLVWMTCARESDLGVFLTIRTLSAQVRSLSFISLIAFLTRFARSLHSPCPKRDFSAIACRVNGRSRRCRCHNRRHWHAEGTTCAPLSYSSKTAFSLEPSERLERLPRTSPPITLAFRLLLACTPVCVCSACPCMRLLVCGALRTATLDFNGQSTERPKETRTRFASSKRVLRKFSSARSSASMAGSAMSRLMSSSLADKSRLSRALLIVDGRGRMTAASMMRGMLSTILCKHARLHQHDGKKREKQESAKPAL